LFLSQRETDLGVLARLVSDSRCRYYFRFHPSQDQLAAGPDNSVLLSSTMAEACTRLPLPVVMAGADAILSHSSAGFLEARYFGLPSVFLSDYVRTLHPSYGSEDLIASSIEHCASDLSGLELASSSASPQDSLKAMIGRLPDIGGLAAALTVEGTGPGRSAAAV
jgi:hypothetical protein